MSVAGLSQDHLNARAAVGLAAVPMDLDNLLEQACIFLGSWAGLGLAVEPVVIAAGGDFQGLAERANGMVGFHRANIALRVDNPLHPGQRGAGLWMYTPRQIVFQIGRASCRERVEMGRVDL